MISLFWGRRFFGPLLVAAGGGGTGGGHGTDGGDNTGGAGMKSEWFHCKKSDFSNQLCYNIEIKNKNAAQTGVITYDFYE